MLEKVLFPCLDEYAEVRDLLAKHHILDHTWVNCTRRMFDHYPKIKASLPVGKPLEMVVAGDDWGLGCNGIHLLDIFAYLTGETNWRLTADIQAIEKSKRAGYIEFIGTLSGTSSVKGHRITLISNPKGTIGSMSIRVSAVGSDTSVVIDEIKGEMNLNGTVSPIAVKYQSQLTNLVAEAILLQNNCPLTRYEESMELHTAFLLPLIEIYNNKHNTTGNYCPIT